MERTIARLRYEALADEARFHDSHMRYLLALAEPQRDHTSLSYREVYQRLLALGDKHGCIPSSSKGAFHG